MLSQGLQSILSLSKVVRFFILSDLFLNFGFGLSGPVFAIFIVQNIKGGDAWIAGLSAGIYWVTKALFQIPISLWLDKKKGEKDDYWFLVFGTFLAGFVPLGYIFISQPWQLYLLQGFLALTMAMAIPSWAAIFSRHLNHGREAFSWGLESSSLSFGAGIAGMIGGVVAKTLGFPILFVGVSIFNFVSGLILLLARKEISPREEAQIFPAKSNHLK